MKKIILVYGFLLSAFLGAAQKQANIWYFGIRVGLDFNHASPIPLNDGKANSTEGISSIADNNGKLLFYSNGLTIMNRLHKEMKNGSSLAGHPSSTNNVVIVPFAGNDSIYYVFTVGAANEESKIFSYSIVNIKGDGGLGEVQTDQKNIIIEDQMFEKIAAIKHCNKRDVWIVVHKWNSDEYHSYLLTAAGLNFTPVISHTSLTIDGSELNMLGTLKFSSKGTKMAAVHSFANDAVELMDFDNTTGVLSNAIKINPNTVHPGGSFKGVYGAEFSPDGRLLYVSSQNSETQKSVLYQFDITSNDPSTIAASKQIIHQNDDFPAGSLQVGPDQKIYMAMFDDTAVSVIDNPNTFGAGCNFVFDKVYLGPSVQYGLPTFMQSYFDPASNPYDFSRIPSNCLEKNIAFKISRLDGIDSVRWNFGDMQESTILQPIHTYTISGFYDVKLIVYKIDCSGLNDTIIRKIWIAENDRFLGNDSTSCNSLSLEIGVEEITGVNYLWNTGAARNKIKTSGFGDYWLELEQNGCKLRDTISISAKPKPTVDLGKDTTICKFKPAILNTATADYDTYLWNTGETTASILVNQTGKYYITVTKDGCENSDTILVKPGDCEVNIPSAFTPNNDNLNDNFGLVENASMQYFSMQIYSKWGQLIFTSNNVGKKWDGNFKGKKMPNGSYVWILNYINSRGRKFYDQGTVMLIR